MKKYISNLAKLKDNKLAHNINKKMEEFMFNILVVEDDKNLRKEVQKPLLCCFFAYFHKIFGLTLQKPPAG